MFKHLEPKDRRQFVLLMRNWDGSQDVLDSFYDLDTLHNIARDARNV
jgi:hypothetical protein